MKIFVAVVFLPLLLSNTWADDQLGQLLETARGRMRCASDPKCLEVEGVERLVRAKNNNGVDPEDLSIVIAHHLLHGSSSCTSQLQQLEVVEEEVMRAIETEDIQGILRTFKKILNDEKKTGCVGIETVLREMSPSSPSFSPMQWVRSVLAIIMEHVLKGQCLDDGVYLRDPLDDLFNRYADACSPYMTANGLQKMIHDLESGGNTHEHHNHDHHHSGEHNHLHGCENHDTEHSHHDHSDHYHSDHDHSNHNHGNHVHSTHDHSNNDHSNHDHSYHNYSDTDHSNHNYRNLNHSDHNNSDHDHSDHDHSDHDHSDHDHSNQNYGEYNDSKHNHYDHKNISHDHNKHNHSGHGHMNIEIKPIGLENFDNTNYSDPIVSENKTIKLLSESLVPATENYSEALENILSSPLSDLWHPTTLSSEDSNLVNNIIPPLNAHPSTLTSQCLSAESLVSRYGSDHISISKAEFLRLCPVLVQQTVGDVCEEPINASLLPSKLEVYGYGSASVFVLCLASLSGVLLLPLMRRNARHYVIAGFQGLAFSTLASDALLHLLPECLGLHSHDHSHGHSHEEASFPEPYAQLMLGFLATTYALFMTEAVLCALSGRSHDQSGRGHTHVHHLSEPTLISIKTKSASQVPISSDQSCSSLDTEIVEEVRKPPNLMVSQPVICGLTSVALVVTLGDALHNFGDGLAIGAAFSANIRGGLSTTAAAFCHELPHELGDFVVLLSTGLSFSRALWLNFLSSLTCFAGLYVGIVVGDNEVARKWVMAVTASTFLYVALAEMVPELREHRHGTPFKMLLVKNIGIIAGVAIMCVISVYEHGMA